MSEKRKLVEKNAEQIGKYLEFRDSTVMKGTAPSYFNLESDHEKPGWTPPMSERGHMSASDPDNIHFSQHVSHILRSLEGTKLYVPATLLEYDPTAIRRWRTKVTENDREQLRKFNRLCRFVAIQLERRYPGIRVRWNVRLEDEETKTLRAYSERQRRIGTEQSYLKLAGQVEKTIEELRAEGQEKGVIEAAKGLVADRMDISYARIHRAWLHKLETDREAG